MLAGDHCQLPPTIKCYETARSGLEQTLMEKVVANKPSVVSLLKVQYRMHEDIMRFSSDWFYDGALEAAPEIRHRGILDWDTPITWLDTSEMDFKEEFIGETFGRINKEEAHLLLKELEAYIQRIGGSRHSRGANRLRSNLAHTARSKDSDVTWTELSIVVFILA